MIVPGLIFITVTLGVAASYQLLSGLLLPASSAVRRRIAEEFRKGGTAGPHAPLFKNLDLLSVDPATGVRPTFVQRLEQKGIKLPSNMFTERVLARD